MDLFWFLRRKKKSVKKDQPPDRPEEIGSQGSNGDSPRASSETAPGKEREEMFQGAFEARSAAPGLGLWHQRIERSRPCALKPGLFPKSLEQIDETQGKVIQDRLADLIPPSPSALKLSILFQNPQTNVKEIAAIASKDPVLSARILRVVNSAYFGLPKEVTSVGRAIVLLGYNQVKALLFDDLIRKNLSKGRRLEGGKADQIWIHSIAVSVCANVLGNRLMGSSPADWATLGLLHDLGKYVLLLLKKQAEPQAEFPLLLQEEQQYGINHAILGTLVAKSWNLPEEISKVIGFHHHPAFWAPEAIPPDFRMSSTIIFLADYLARALGFKEEKDELYFMRGDTIDFLGIDPDLKGLVTPVLVGEIEKSIALNELEGFFPGMKEVKGDKELSRSAERERRDDSFEIECPKC